MNKHAQALGRLGGAAGKGKAKARSPEQARAAAQARWQKRRKTQKRAERPSKKLTCSEPAAGAIEPETKKETKHGN